ncbi:hypothetical protein [Neotamlana laminarinivorans]|uniref:Lipoprotein n=1 Tax=Neotamlana laminarinivorans TaxID=2883124 RepID=A0A9X1L2P2_9FLAO|nr:hypothetical protein [Tamlana laminarinivorans]MCB4799978.1 hypothetical protein [Tamlana laminarinivorans]
MKKIYLLLIVLFFLGCIGKEKKNIALNREAYIFWIDTISNGKFLKIYSNPEKDEQNLTAVYGNEKIKNKINLLIEDYQITRIPFSNKVNWITEKSFAIVYACGTGCINVIIFNIEKEKPLIQTILYYPSDEYLDFETDNPNLYIASIGNIEDNPSFVIIDTDTQKKDTINLPKKWIRGLGTIYNIVDKLKIENSIIEIIQNQEKGEIKKIQETIHLK